MGRKLKDAKRSVIVVYKGVDLIPYGIFINPHHLEENISIRNANIGKYLNYQMFTLSEYVAVQTDIGKEGITNDLFNKCHEQAKQRLAMADVNKLTLARLRKLRPEQILAINRIISDK